MKLAVSVAAVLTVALTSACGQKGALYLPKRGTVVTRPAGSNPPPASTPAPAKPDDQKDDDKPKPQR